MSFTISTTKSTYLYQARVRALEISLSLSLSHSIKLITIACTSSSSFPCLMPMAFARRANKVCRQESLSMLHTKITNGLRNPVSPIHRLKVHVIALEASSPTPPPPPLSPRPPPSSPAVSVTPESGAFRPSQAVCERMMTDLSTLDLFRPHAPTQISSRYSFGIVISRMANSFPPPLRSV